MNQVTIYCTGTIKKLMSKMCVCVRGGHKLLCDCSNSVIIPYRDGCVPVHWYASVHHHDIV